jgi:transposase
MSNSDNIIHLLELEDVEITGIETTPDANYLHLEVPLRNHVCPACGTLTHCIHDYREQKVLDLPFYAKCTFLIYRKRRYRCPTCGKRFFEENTFLPRYAHTTNRFFFKLFQELHSVVSQKSIAEHFTTSTMRIRRVLDAVVPSLPELPEVLGIDEFRGNTNRTKYHCVLTDLSTSKPIDILNNRTEATLIHHFRKYQHTGQLEKVKFIVIDMWRVYYSVLQKIFPHAIIIIDRFHFVRQAVWGLENVRKRIQKTLPDSLRVYFKKSRSVLLKRSKHLIVNETVDEVRQRDRMLEFFPDLKKAYDLKEEILWMVHEVHDLDTARIYLNEWIRKADASGIPEFKSAVTAYRNWKIPILNAFAYPYSNGITEGCNNKIKVIKRNAFGLRNFDRFRTRILLAFA